MSASSHGVTVRLGAATSVLIYVLMVIGSVVRTTNSGLACPDWPLCQGHLIPPFEFHVLIEWFHRFVALLVGIALFATSLWIWTHREDRARVGAHAAVAVGLYFAQALLGAFTVWKGLSPAIVSAHLVVAMLLFATLLTLTLTAAAPATPAVPRAPRPAGLVPLLSFTAFWTWLQVGLGGMVSSSHAGCVCPDWPTCNGAWFPPLKGLIGLQMMHRYSAYVLLVLAIANFALWMRSEHPRIGRLVTSAFALTVLQVILGVMNVFAGTPPWLSALHLATAAAILAHYVLALFHAARWPAAPVALAAAIPGVAR